MRFTTIVLWSITGAFVLSFGCTPPEQDRDCSDFQCQDDAQAWHNRHPEDGLDADNDGIACEHLPRCSTLEGHEHIVLPPVQRGLGVGDGLTSVNTWYVGVEPESRFQVSVLLDEGTLARLGEAPLPVPGVVRWGTSADAMATGNVLYGAITGGLIHLTATPQRHPLLSLQAMPSSDEHFFGVILDPRPGAGWLTVFNPMGVQGLPDTLRLPLTRNTSLAPSHPCECPTAQR